MTAPSGPSRGVPAGGPLKISVVVPVYNPGRYLEACVSSVLGQTMPRQEYEAIFVDDGSTDGSAEYLDALAAREPNVRVLHLPGSGAPGAPRNAGIDAARGAFVQFLDSDDELAPDALERLHGMAEANGTDIVLGKFASASMPRRQDLFRVTRRRCTLVDTPGLVDGSLGPTKLFRTSLLRRHSIRFPEGWRHMEDQLFTIHAYLRARSFSILGDAPCYWFNVREDGTNISHERVDPAVHMAHLGQIVDLVERVGPPGELRDRIVRRFYRAEALARLNETTYLDHDPDYQAALFAAIRDFARAKVPQRLDADLGIVTALRSSLVRRGRQAETVELAERARAVDVRAVAGPPRWRGGRLIVPFEAWLARSADDPFVVVERDGRFLLDPSFTNAVTDRPVVIDGPTRSARATAILREPESVLEWILPSASSVELVDVGTLDGGRCLRPTIRGSITVDPEHVGPEFQRLAPGTWDLLVRLASLGIERTSLVVLDPGAGPAEGRRPTPAPQPALLGRPPRFVVPSVGPSRGLVVHVGAARDEPWPAPASDPAAAPLGRSLALRRAALLLPPPELELLLPIATDGVGRTTAAVAVGWGPASRSAPARVEPRYGQLGLRATLPDVDALPPGRHDLVVELAGEPSRWRAASVVVDDGHVRVEGAVPIGRSRRARRAARFVLQRRTAAASLVAHQVAARGESAARGAFRGLPVPLRAPAARLYRRVRR